jgi:3-hydroxybutyryl-CoA dehydrogenase
MKVKVIAVIGAGATGRAYAQAAALAGFRIIFEDVSQAAVEQAVASVSRVLDECVAQGKIDAGTRDAAVRNLATASTVEDAIRDADLIIETLPEEMEMHIELFTILDKFAKPGAIFACGTAELSISEMAEVTFCAERCIGMRLRDRTVELVKGRETAQETVALCSELARLMARDVVVLREFERRAVAATKD